jgi:hypothetical protein
VRPVDGQLQALEEALMQVNMKGSEANLAFPGKLNEQYAGFAAALEDSDTPPTRQQREMFQSLHGDLGVQLGLWSKLQGGALADLQRQIAAK